MWFQGTHDLRPVCLWCKQSAAMLRGGAGSAFAPGRNGAISPTTLQKEAMERPSAWARDEDLEEGRRIHDAKAVSTASSALPASLVH